MPWGEHLMPEPSAMSGSNSGRRKPEDPLEAAARLQDRRLHLPSSSGRSTPKPARLQGPDRPALARQATMADQPLWACPDGPAWARGGSYQVLQIIRMFVEFWD